MLSILIPVFNYDIRILVSELIRQASIGQYTIEIIVSDDGSEHTYKEVNREVSVYERVNYFENEQNLGRSKIRNRLASFAAFDNLLFIDCDSEIHHAKYLHNYVRDIGVLPVICGGTAYQAKPGLKNNLRWLYGVKREQKNAEVRNVKPNQSFQTNNFLIQKQVFESIKFNENISGYGHEDTWFGFELWKRGIKIHHIDNALIHLGLDENEAFLKKTRKGIANLVQLIGMNEKVEKDYFIDSVSLLKVYYALKSLRLAGLLRFFFKWFESGLHNNLSGSKPSLICFDFYKLGLLSDLMQKNR